tara:strand:- start:1422 stop:1805 length:384 start_codon:yes stop_codon:yes gene_type:complete
MEVEKIDTTYKSLSKKPDPGLCQEIVGHLEENKAVDLVAIDLATKSSIADYLVIASGTSSRHIKSLSDKVKEKLHHIGIKKVRVEGTENADWILVDGGNIIIHLFRPEVRDFYGLEKMWQADFAEKE